MCLKFESIEYQLEHDKITLINDQEEEKRHCKQYLVHEY